MKPFFLVLSFLSLTGAWAQAPLPFHRGVNLSTWFQPDQPGRLPFGRFGEQDFRDLKTLGADAVRLPINFAGLTGPAPGYALDARVFRFLDQAVGWAEEQGIVLVLDNHSDPTDTRVRSDLTRFLTAVWTQMAVHYRDRPADVLYEIQNEPHQLNQAWAPIQGKVIDAIRTVDTAHTIVVGGDDWNSIKGLTALPAYADKNLLYTFHFYDPFVFTHQGAGWTDQKDLSGVSFPPSGAPPAFSGPGKAAWVAKAVREYYARDAVADLTASLDKAAAFARDRNVPVWCGEFGVYNRNADPAQRVEWYRTVRGLLDARGIPWTTWDYRNTFGLFNKDSAEVFDQDLNLPLVEALGFRAVPQRPSGPVPQTAGFFLYRDAWEGGSREGGYTRQGLVDYADPVAPASGGFSVRISRVARYDDVDWVFAPWKDMTALSNASLELDARSSAPKFSVEVRFVDGAVPGGLPWRLAATIGSDQVPGDGQWHHVAVPFAAMKVTGAWDGTWHEAKGAAFDWTRVDRFQIVAEQGDLAEVTLGFDNIQVVAGAR